MSHARIFANIDDYRLIQIINITSIDEVKDPRPFNFYVDNKGITYEYGECGFSEMTPKRLRSIMISYLLHDHNCCDEDIYKIWKTGADHVVISVDGTALANHIFYGLPIYAAVLTEDGIGAPDTSDRDAQSILFNTQPYFSILCRDDNIKYDFYSKYPTKTATFTYGHDRDCDLRINRQKLYKMGTETNVTYSGRSFDMATYVANEAAVNYMAAAALAGFAIGADIDSIVDGIANYEPKIN